MDDLVIEIIDEDEDMDSDDAGDDEGEPIAETNEDYFDEIVEIENWKYINKYIWYVILLSSIML